MKCAYSTVPEKNATSGAHRAQQDATTLLCSTIQEGDFACTRAGRASNVLGPVSRHHLSQILPMMCNASRARSGLAVGALPVLCNGLCTSRRFHLENDDQHCRRGCPDEPECLSHCNRRPRLHDAFKKTWRNAGFRLRGDLLLHDLFTQALLRSIQHGKWSWASLMHLFTHAISIGTQWIIVAVLMNACKDASV